jgi:hypothetical protein
MSLRSIAARAILALQLILPLCSCATTAAKPPNAAIDDLERRHDETMRTMGGGTGM